MSRLRLSDAYATLADFGLEARDIDDSYDLLVAFQPLKQSYKYGSRQGRRVYVERLRPAMVLIRSHLQQIHRKVLGPDASKIGVAPSRRELSEKDCSRGGVSRSRRPRAKPCSNAVP